MFSEETLQKIDTYLDNHMYRSDPSSEILSLTQELQSVRDHLSNRLYDLNNHMFNVADELKKMREMMQVRHDQAEKKRHAVEEFSLFG